MFEKILIANRGEIACRVIRTCRRLGIKTVAVYSEADVDAPHVRMAEEAVAIGPPPAVESYLRIDRIVDAARRTGAQAVHPGYGFLSENPVFAEALEAEGIVFIGPPASAIRLMGDKLEAKRLAAAAGVTIVPGHAEAVREPGLAARIAAGIGYPVMVKAAAGGGGKGMRIALNERDLREALERAAERGALVLRRRPRVPREVRSRAAPHRDPGPGRPARQHALPGRARMLDPAPPSEGHRGGAEPVPRRRHAAGHGRAGGGARARSRLPLGRHGRVHRRCRAQLLLPRDEHPPPGRAPGDRAGDRARPGRADAAGGGRRAARLDPGPAAPGRLGDRGAGLRRGPRARFPPFRSAGSGATSSRRARASGSMPAWSRAARSRSITTR